MYLKVIVAREKIPLNYKLHLAYLPSPKGKNHCYPFIILKKQTIENDPTPAQCQKTFSTHLIRRIPIILNKNVACNNHIQDRIKSS